MMTWVQWEAERAAAHARDAARRREAVVRPLRGLVRVDPIHVLRVELIDPFWRITPPPMPAPEVPPAEEPPAEAVQPPPTTRDPWAVLPDSVRIVPWVDGARHARMAERLWIGGSLEQPDLLVQRLDAALRTEGIDFHADLRGCDEDTRAWALETAERAGLDPATWCLTVWDTQHWEVESRELDRMPAAPNAELESDPVFAALADAKVQQHALNHAEYLRVDAAVRAWRVALAEEGLPGSENTHYQSGFFQDLGLHIGVSERTAKSMVHVADRLARDLPATWERFRSGAVPWRTMQATHAAIDGIEDDDVLARFDGEAAVMMDETPVVQLPDALRRLAERLQPTTLDDRFARAFARRFVRIEPGKDGMGWLTAFLPMTTLSGIDHQLTQAAIAEHDRAAGETGGITVLRADVFVDGVVDGLSRDAEPAVHADPTDPIEAGATAEPAADAADSDEGSDDDDEDGFGPLVPNRRGVQARIGILIPAMTVLGHSDAPATLEGYGPIPMRTALALAGDATSWTRVLTDRFTGAVITVGREKYRPTADMRAMLRMLDGGGRGPGCLRPPSQTEVDHNRSFWLHGEGGQTSIRNLVLLSNRDHAKKTSGESSADLLRDRTLIWRTRAGVRYVTRPHDPPVATPVPPELIAEGDDDGACPF